MSDWFMGEIRLLSFTFPPQGWALCNGQQLPINQNQALFSILGTTYGGNGQTTFALPDLRGRHPAGLGSHLGTGAYLTLGQSSGAESHTLTVAEMPAHTHPVRGSASSTSDAPAGRLWGPLRDAYGGTPDGTLHPSTVDSVGGGQAHANMAPYLVLTYVIALTGTFPSPTSGGPP